MATMDTPHYALTQAKHKLAVAEERLRLLTERRSSGVPAAEVDALDALILNAKYIRALASDKLKNLHTLFDA